tara:strand:- start:20 stop:232 length:213 start_codon:yes stop_codon:yes gene_type:complete
MSETLDLKNIIEIKKISAILEPHPDLLKVFELVLRAGNVKINDERACGRMEIEPNIEPNLSSDSEDDIFF